MRFLARFRIFDLSARMVAYPGRQGKIGWRYNSLASMCGDHLIVHHVSPC
jgi:hypothetical protein